MVFKDLTNSNKKTIKSLKIKNNSMELQQSERNNRKSKIIFWPLKTDLMALYEIKIEETLRK